MGANTNTKVGVRVEEEVWSRFKQFVEDKHNRKRGVLGREVEKALKNHLEADNPTEPISRIENDMATMKTQISELSSALLESDGGEVAVESSVDPNGGAPAPPSDDAAHTHTHTDTPASERNLSNSGTEREPNGNQDHIDDPDEADPEVKDDTEAGGSTPEDPEDDVEEVPKPQADTKVEDEFDRIEAGHPANKADEGNDSDTQVDDGDDSDTLSKPGRKASHRKKAKYVFHELSNGGDTAIVPASAVESEVDRLWGFGERTTTKVIDRVFDRYHPEAVNKGPAWFVALGRTSQARDDAIVEWQDGDGEDTKIVLEDAFDGFDDDGLPAGVRSNQDTGGGRKR